MMLKKVDGVPTTARINGRTSRREGKYWGTIINNHSARRVPVPGRSHIKKKRTLMNRKKDPSKPAKASSAYWLACAVKPGELPGAQKNNEEEGGKRNQGDWKHTIKNGGANPERGKGVPRKSIVA